MQRIIDVLLSFRNGILYIVLMLFSIYFLTQRSFYHQTQLGKLSLYLTGNLHELRKDATRYLYLKKENDNLIRENEALKAIFLKSNQSKSALPIFNNQGAFPYTVIPARIIYSEQHNARNFALVNKGTNDSITTEMGVIGARGVLGIVDEVSPNYAAVITLLNFDLGLNVRLKNQSVFGSLSWNGKSPYTMQLNDIVATANVQLGDTVVSSGRSSYFPSGIPVGRISSLDKKTVQGYYTIEINLFESPVEMENVYFLKNIYRSEIESLIQNTP